MSDLSPYRPPASIPPIPQAVLPAVRMPLRDVLFSYRGRIPRSTFWLWSVALTGVFLLVILGVIPLMDSGGVFMAIGLVIVIPAFAVMTWCTMALTVKRWHDHGMSGWYALLGFIPYLGGIINFVVLGCLKGNEGGNRFGSDPLAGKRISGPGIGTDYAQHNVPAPLDKW